MKSVKLFLLFFIYILFINSALAQIKIPTSSRAEKAMRSVETSLKKALSKEGLQYGSPIFIRIFKDPGILEVWVESENKKFKKFKSYKICYFSGKLGPKIKQGDNQSPEGFYFVNPNRLNPWSSYHLSFNLGYPNKYDRYHNRTGSALMVHGNCVSIGCYAMTNNYINEIYALSVSALKSGQAFFRVHVFPFKLEPEILIKYKKNQWYSFWINLQEGYQYFKIHKRPPNVTVSSNGKYIFN